MVVLLRCISIACDIFMGLLCIRAAVSWFVASGNKAAMKINSISIALTDFLVKPCRKLIAGRSNSAFDWSLLLAFLIAVLIRDMSMKGMVFLAN